MTVYSRFLFWYSYDKKKRKEVKPTPWMWSQSQHLHESFGQTYSSRILQHYLAQDVCPILPPKIWFVFLVFLSLTAKTKDKPGTFCWLKVTKRDYSNPSETSVKLQQTCLQVKAPLWAVMKPRFLLKNTFTKEDDIWRVIPVMYYTGKSALL